MSDTVIELVKALHQYIPEKKEKEKTTKLPLNVGDVIEVIAKKSNGWWKGKKKTQTKKKKKKN